MTLATKRTINVVDVAGLLAAAGGDSFAGAKVEELALDTIDPNPRQPRTQFVEGALDELVENIRQHGILQPVVVRAHPNQAGRWQLIAGERRVRAAKEAGLLTVPAIVKHVEDSEMLILAVVENTQRQNMTMLDTCKAMATLREEGLTNGQIGKLFPDPRTGRALPESAVSERISLTSLPQVALEKLEEGVLTFEQARIFSRLWKRLERLKHNELRQMYMGDANYIGKPAYDMSNLDIERVFAYALDAYFDTPDIADNRRHTMTTYDQAHFYPFAGWMRGRAFDVGNSPIDVEAVCVASKCPYFATSQLHIISRDPAAPYRHFCLDKAGFETHQADAQKQVEINRAKQAQEAAADRPQRDNNKDFLNKMLGAGQITPVEIEARIAEIRNAWSDNLHLGPNTSLVLRTHDGRSFDVDFHTLTSLGYGNGTIPMRDYSQPAQPAETNELDDSIAFFKQALKAGQITNLAIAQGIVAYLKTDKELTPNTIINITGTPNMTARWKVLEAMLWSPMMAYEKIRLNTPPAAPSDPYRWLVEKALADGDTTPDAIERAIIGAREVCELNFGTLIPINESTAVTFGTLDKMGYGKGTYLGVKKSSRDFDAQEPPVQEEEVSQLEIDLYSLWGRFADMTDVDEAIPDDKIAAFIKTLDAALSPVARLDASVSWLLKLFCTAPASR